MKKLNFLILLLFSGFCFAQVSVFSAMKSEDPTVVEEFISKNPKHPRVPELRKKLQSMQYKSTSSTSGNVTSRENDLTSKKLSKNIDKARTAEKGSETANLLNHLFQNNAMSKETLLQVVNKSSCPLVIKVSGKKFYNFNVAARNQHHIILDKGSYTVSTIVCGAKFSEKKVLTANTVITLNN